MKNIKEIYNSLPSNWNEFKWKNFHKTLDIKISESTGIEAMFDGCDNILKLLSALTGIEESYFENLPMNEFAYLAGKLSFINTQPEVGKHSTIEWKDFDTLSYNSYIVYMQLANKPMENMHQLIQAFSNNKLTKEDIDNMSVTEVNTAFFTLRKRLRKFYKRSIVSTTLQLMKMQLKNLYQIIRTKVKFRNKRK